MHKNQIKILIDEIEKKREEIIELTRYFIQIPSISTKGNEEEMAMAIIKRLNNKPAWKINTVEPEPGRINVLADVIGSAPGPKLLFNGHMDVVSPGDRSFWNFDPFDAVVREGKIWGRGAMDMKAALAAFIVAMETIFDLEIDLKGTISFHAVADEEIFGRLGTLYLLVNNYVEADYCIVGEGSVFNGEYCVVPACAGACWVKVITHGKSAHGSRPWEGKNASLMMAKLLLALDSTPLEYTPHPMVAPPSIAAGTFIHGGGNEINSIPDYCEAGLDIRVVPGTTDKDILNHVEKVISKLKNEDPNFSAEAKIEVWDLPVDLPQDSKLVKLARDAGKEVLGKQPPFHKRPSTTDARFFNSFGIPALVAFGPGDIITGGMHLPNENISIDNIVTFSKIYGAMILISNGK